MRNIYRSKLRKRDASISLFFFMLTREENTTEGESIPFKKILLLEEGKQKET
jgi:hypothetical protein